MNKTALTITVALTVFLLFIAAGVYFGVKAAQPATAASIPTMVTIDAPVSTQDVVEQVQSAVQQRDEAYQDLINQANARIDTLQKENQALQEQLNGLQTSSPQTSTSAGITPETAAQVAAFWVGDNQIYSVEGVTIQNTPLFKVTFSSGVIVYVSLDGQVVGSQMPATSAGSTGDLSRHGGGGDDDHDGGDDD